MFSVQFITLTSPFTPSESSCLVCKPHPQFLAQNLSKKLKCGLYTSVYGILKLISFATDVSSRFVQADVWFIVLLIWVLI